MSQRFIIATDDLDGEWIGPARTGIGIAGGDPTSVTGLVLWLKADTLGLSDGDPITSWTDSSGSGHTATGVGTNKPKYKVSQLNGLPGVLFDIGLPDDNYFIFTDWVSGFTAGEIFMVLKVTTDPGDGSGGGLETFGVSDFATNYPYSDGVIYSAWGTSARKNCGDPAASLASFHLLNIRSVASDWELFINSSSQFSTGTNTVSFATSCRIGLNQGGTSFKGTICEVVMYNKGLNGTERSTLRTYFTGRYGVP